jgi:DNA-binding LacI/PurR family transcriptional regulator
MGVTIYDLAREAGVGIGTVSRCLNNHPSVSAETRSRVMAVVKRLSYQPHAYAQKLASKKTNTISAIIPFFTNYFFMQVLQGVQDKAGELGFDLILYGVTHPEQAEYYLRRSLQRGHVDGVMYFSMALPESYVTKFEQINLPLIMVDGYHPHFDSLRVKNREGAMVAVRHLVSLGHSSIAMINASQATLPARDRLEGYRNALEEAGLQFREDRVYDRVVGHQDGFDRESGRASMIELLRANTGQGKVTAVFIASDVQAMGALEAAAEAGVRVPEDLAIVSFDDIELARHMQLTTMRQPMNAMGVLAAERLFERMKDPQLPPQVTSFVPEIIIRRSCGASRLSEAVAPHAQARIELVTPQGDRR